MIIDSTRIARRRALNLGDEAVPWALGLWLALYTGAWWPFIGIFAGAAAVNLLLKVVLLIGHYRDWWEVRDLE